MPTISLEQFHDLLSYAYAVCVNDTLYFVGYDDDEPYIATNANEDYVSLSEVDGDIELNDNELFFYIQGDAFTMKILTITEPKNLLK